CYKDLKNQTQHIETVIIRQTSEQIASNRLRLKTIIDVVRWLTFQGCALRGHDERFESRNHGNFFELIKLLASYDKNVDEVVLKNAPSGMGRFTPPNASYISSTIQKEILYTFANKIQGEIRKEICDKKFCIIVDEAKDDSQREQMAIVLRFVDKEGFVNERFFDV
ncbi:DUF4371 domain-containing protein, partial [Cephalotus follicularis]